VKVTTFAVKRRIATSVIAIALIVLGSMALPAAGQLSPEITYP
jgi:multidrug efflux pump subunit AcrB